MNKTLRTFLTLILAATFLFSVAYALDSSAEKDFLSYFFDERQVDALQDYQQRYTANEFLALKIKGRLPALPAAASKPEPLLPVQEIVTEQPEQLPLEKEETVQQPLVLDSD